jgi:hypothetical protein
MNQTPILTPRQFVRYAILLVAVIALGIGIWFALTHGGINIKTASDTAEITVVPVGDENRSAATATGKTLSTILRNGNYIATVKDGNKQIRTTLTVSSFKTAEITLDPPTVGTSEPVTNLSASSFAASSTSLSLLDDSYSELVSIDNSNMYRHTDSNDIRYETAIWASASKGYAIGRQSVSNDRVLVEISGSTVTKITTPLTVTSESYLASGVNAAGELYLLQDGKLYHRNTDGSYQYLTSTNKEASILSVSNSYVTFIHRSSEEACEVQFYNLATKTLTKRQVQCVQDPYYSYRAEWSPNGKELALTTGDALQILDNQLKTTKTIPDYAATNPIWTGDNKLVYTSKNNVWSYNTASNTSSVIAATPDYVSVLSLRKSDDSNTLYFSGVADNATTLYRLSSTVKELGSAEKLGESNMQTLTSSCQIRYLNFTQLQLLLITAESTRAKCNEDATNYLQSIGASVTSIQFDNREEYGYGDYINEP